MTNPSSIGGTIWQASLALSHTYTTVLLDTIKAGMAQIPWHYYFGNHKTQQESIPAASCCAVRLCGLLSSLAYIIVLRWTRARAAPLFLCACRGVQRQPKLNIQIFFLFVRQEQSQMYKDLTRPICDLQSPRKKCPSGSVPEYRRTREASNQNTVERVG